MRDYPKLIEDTEFLLKDKGKQLATAQHNHKKLQESQSRLVELIKQLQADLDEKENLRLENVNSINAAKAAIRLCEDERKSLEQDLADLQREQKISELQSKQKDFWEALESRLAFQIKNLDDGLEGISQPQDPSAICKQMKALADGMNFNVQANAIRNVRGVYSQTLLKLCEMSVDGKQILPEHKQERLNVLDRFLMNKTIAPMWNA